MSQPRIIRNLGNIAVFAVVALVLLANAESEVAMEDSAFTGWQDDSRDMEVLVQEDSDDSQQLARVEALEVAWKSKEQHVQNALSETTAAKKAQLKKHMAQELTAKNAVQLQMDAEESDLLEADPKAEVKKANSQLASKSKELGKAKKQIETLKSEVKDQKAKAKLDLKKADAEAKKKLITTVADTKTKLRKEVDGSNMKLLKEQKREKKMMQQVIKNRTEKEAEKVKLADQKARKAAHKGGEQKAVQSAGKWKAEAQKEKMLRKKAVQVAKQLGQKIKTLATFSKQSAGFAKQQAAKAEKATTDAKDQVNLMNAQKVKAKQQVAEIQAEEAMFKQKLQQAAANVAQSEAKAVHQKAAKEQLVTLLSTTRAQLNQTLLDRDALQAQSEKRKLAERRAAAEAAKRKAEEKKALKLVSKIGDMQKSIQLATDEKQRVQNLNANMREALAAAALKEEMAANVTKQAAEHAEAIERQALTERAMYKKTMAKSKTQVEIEHQARLDLVKKSSALLEKSKNALIQEHRLRKAAQQTADEKTAAAKKAEDDLNDEHKQRLATKATADSLAEERDRLTQRVQAATQMIAVSQEGTTDAKQAAQDMELANSKKLTTLKSKYDQLLKDEHDKAEKAQAVAETVTSRTTTLKQAIDQEKKILQDEQDKARKKQAKWTAALAAFKQERVAHTAEAGAVDQSSKMLVNKAKEQLKKATDLASAKDELLAQLKQQLKTQADKFASAAADWAQVKHKLQQRTKVAEDKASQAYAKLAQMAQHSQYDGQAAVAENAVNKAIAQTSAAAEAAQPMPMDVKQDMAVEMAEVQLNNEDDEDEAEDQWEGVPEEVLAEEDPMHAITEVTDGLEPEEDFAGELNKLRN
jgi:hypothetical protein